MHYFYIMKPGTISKLVLLFFGNKFITIINSFFLYIEIDRSVVVNLFFPVFTNRFYRSIESQPEQQPWGKKAIPMVGDLVSN